VIVEVLRLAFVVLGVTAAQTAVFVAIDSVALLADLMHNVGGAATAIPVGVVFALRSASAERVPGGS
jgi:divalent metal cation (Fe/Co/Zn/Cd) transporter